MPRTSAKVGTLLCALVLTPACAVVCGGCAPESEFAAGSAELVDEQLRVRFDDAALYCDLRLLGSALSAERAESLGDAALVAYARTIRRARRVRITTGPHAGGPEVSARQTDPNTNACQYSTSTELGASMLSDLDDGFCRADFNHCLGRELEAHAVSLPSGSAQSELRASLMRMARERLQASAVEYVASIAFYDRVCTEGAASGAYAYECSVRLSTGGGPSYLRVAHARLLEGVERIIALSQFESSLRVDVGDRRQRETPPDPGETIAALFGPEGARSGAVASLYGPPDGVSFETRPNARRLVPVALPQLPQPDEHVARALELIRQQSVVTFLSRETPSSGVVLLPSGVGIHAAFQLLDHRLAAGRYAAPYDETRPADPATDLGTVLRSRRPLAARELNPLITSPFPLHRSILATEERVTLEDVARALYLLDDAYETQFGRFVFAPQVHFGAPGVENGGRRLLSLVEATPAPRPAEMLTAAFSEEVGLPSADALRPMLAPMPRRAAGPTGDFYRFDLRRADGSLEGGVQRGAQAALGAAGALHFLRVHLLRLGSEAGPSGLLDAERAAQAVALIEQAIGGRWSEHDTTRDAACACIGGGGGPPVNPFPLPGDPIPLPDLCPDRAAEPLYAPCENCSCRLEPPAAGVIEWDLYEPADARLEGFPTAVFDVDSVRCLVQERRPGTVEPCPLAATPMVPRRDVTTRLGRVRRTYQVPEGPGPESHAFIVWVGPEGRRLVDVLSLGSAAGVHPIGGAFSDLAADVWRQDPWRPGHASSSSGGMARGLVPPLESELISDSDRYEDSFAAYLTDAELAVQRAQLQLEESRRDALQARRDGLSDRVLLDEAALVETGTLAELCGDTRGCSVPRVGATTPLELGLVGDPPPPPDLGPYADCAEVAAGVFTDFHERVSTGFSDDNEARGFINAHMTRVLGCSMYTYLRELAALPISDLPAPVVAALATGDDAEFSAFSGRLRISLLRLFAALDTVRTTARRLEAQRFAALVEIDAAANLISYVGNDSQDRDLCNWGDALSIAQSVGSIVTSAAGAGNAAIGSTDNWQRTVARESGSISGEGANIANRVNHQVATNNCRSEEAAETQASRSATQMVASLSTLRSLAQQATAAARSTFYIMGSLQGLERGAALAGRRRDVARQLAASNGLADLPEWQALRGFSQRRAARSLARAQDAVFVARRAIEFRLGIDLSSMTEAEPLVPPPSTWVDSLFDIGGASLSVPGSAAEVPIAAEELARYIDRLRRFVDGYPIARRFRDAGDTQILDVGALVGAPSDQPATEQIIFTCAAHPTPLLGGRLPGAEPGPPCEGLGEVVRAEVHFVIPARLDGYLSDRLAAGSFNYRHELLAPNLAGTGVLDCERALDRAECYSDGNIVYSMRHEGPFSVENFGHGLETFFLEPGVILNGRALVAERVLTTPLGAADRTLVSAFYREELRGRPLAGLYSLTIEGRPEIQWSRIDRIQLLLGYRYWTRQE